MSNEFLTFTKPFPKSEREQYEREILKATYGRPRKIRRITGTTFLRHLTLLFIGLKLTGHIGWSWWLVLLPLIFDSIAVAIAQSYVTKGQRALGYLPTLSD